MPFFRRSFCLFLLMLFGNCGTWKSYIYDEAPYDYKKDWGKNVGQYSLYKNENLEIIFETPQKHWKNCCFVLYHDLFPPYYLDLSFHISSNCQPVQLDYFNMAILDMNGKPISFKKSYFLSYYKNLSSSRAEPVKPPEIKPIMITNLKDDDPRSVEIRLPRLLRLPGRIRLILDIKVLIDNVPMEFHKELILQRSSASDIWIGV